MDDLNLVEALDVTKTYGTGHTAVTAVKGVDLTLRKGEILLIMGPSGSGKTTLLSMIGCLLRPSTGRINVNGRDIAQLSDKELSVMRSRKYGFVFQSFNLLSALTASENVQVALNLAGMKGVEAHDRAHQLLTDLDMEERLDFYPADLSGGEQQRVSLARALANNPSILLADEPTANLDSLQMRKVLDKFERIVRGRDCGLIIVSHDPRVKPLADRVLYLQDGRLVSAEEQIMAEGVLLGDPI